MFYAYDPEDAGSLSFSLVQVGTDPVKFAINATSGAVYLTSALDYETKDSYQLLVTAQDIDGNTSSCDIYIIVDNVVEPGDPLTFDQSPYTFQLDEDDPIGTYVGQVYPTGPGAFTLSLFGTDASYFTIDQNGKLHTAQYLHTNKASYSFWVNATQTSSPYSVANASVTVNVTPVNDAPYFSTGTYSWTGPEDTPVGTVPLG